MSSNEAAWRSTLPGLIDSCVETWQLRLGSPYTSGTGSFVARVTTPDGTAAVLKLSFPHREARGEAEALRWWDGRGAIRLIAEGLDGFALLVERCDPGTPLTARTDLSAAARLGSAAELLARLWETGVPEACTLERVGDVCAEWADLAERRMAQLEPPYDPGLVAYGIDLLRSLPASASREVVVHGDVNPGNVLAARRAAWLAIDPKPMVGDPGYDLCPLVLQVDEPFEHGDPAATLRSRFGLVSDVVGEPADRLLAWSIARCVESALWYADRSEIENGTETMDAAAVMAELLDRTP